MALTLVNQEVSDLCIGKPPLRCLPMSATVGDVLQALRESDDDPYNSVWIFSNSTTGGNVLGKTDTVPFCVGKICVVDVICYLCSGENVRDPSTALKSSVSVLLGKESSALVRRVEANSRFGGNGVRHDLSSLYLIVEALRVILDGAQNVVVPTNSKKPHHLITSSFSNLCCLTQEDLVRFFLNSINHFSPISFTSIEDLHLIRTEIFTVHLHAPAISTVHLVKQAVLSQTAIAVVDDDNRFVGEVSPSTVALCGSGPLAVLSVRELIAYGNSGRCPLRSAVETVKLRLKAKGLIELLDMMEEETNEDENEQDELLYPLSSSDEEMMALSLTMERRRRRRRMRRKRSGGWGRISEVLVVCHPRSSLVAVMMQALAHRISYVWVVEDDYELVGIVRFTDIIGIFGNYLD